MDLKAVIQSTTLYRGPVPPPKMLAEYNQAFPDGADRLVKMVEAQAAHRIAMEYQVITSQLEDSKRGQWLASALAVLLIIAGTWLSLAVHDAVGGVIFSTTLIGLVTVFIAGKYSQQKDLDRKKQLWMSEKKPKGIQRKLKR